MPINVCVTGGAGRIAYALIPWLLDGGLFNSDKLVHLRLLDIAGTFLEMPILNFEFTRHILLFPTQFR